MLLGQRVKSREACGLWRPQLTRKMPPAFNANFRLLDRIAVCLQFETLF